MSDDWHSPENRAKREQRHIFWLNYWACFGKSMAGWLTFVCVLPLIADTSSVTVFSAVGSFYLWAAMAAIWSTGPAEDAVRNLREKQP